MRAEKGTPRGNGCARDGRALKGLRSGAKKGTEDRRETARAAAEAPALEGRLAARMEKGRRVEMDVRAMEEP